MAWTYNKRAESRKDAWSIEEPSSKKRKVGTEETGDDWGDDSLELTQAEIESMDVMASQALGSSQILEQSTSVELFTRPANPVQPSSHSHRSSSSSSSSSASTSSDSSLRPKSLNSSSLLSGRSLSSHSSNSNGSSSLSHRPDDRKLDSITELKTELEKKDQEIRNAVDEKYRSDGEVKYLRQMLQKREVEIDQLRVQKNAEDDQWKKKQADKEKKLKLQVDKLMSEAHFKEREYQESIQVLEKKLKERVEKEKSSPSEKLPTVKIKQSQETKVISKPCSPQKKTVKPSPPSKQKQNRMDEPLSCSQLPEFPTQSSFMEKSLNHFSHIYGLNQPQGQSPKARTSLVLSQNKSVSCQAQTFSSEALEKSHPHHSKRKTRRLQFKKECSDMSSGPHIVSELIRPSCTSANGVPGLPGLLQALSTSLTLDSLSYSRNKDNSFLSPVKPQRRSCLLSSVPSVSGGKSSSGCNNVQVVSPDNFHLAIQGLDMLLHRAQTQDKNLQFDGSILLIPMLSDYLHHYLNHIVTKGGSDSGKSPTTTPVIASNTSNHHHHHHHHSHSLHHTGSGVCADSVSLYTGSSGSYDSSLDSLSSSVIHLLQEGKMYAVTMEKYALSALQCLGLLIQLCPVVTSVLVHPTLIESKMDTSDTVSKHVLKTESINKKIESGTDADDEKSTSSSEIRIIADFNSKSTIPSFSSTTPLSLHNQSRLLLCVTILAAENLEESSVSPLVVEESLRVLNCLCDKCNAQEFLRLEHVIMKEALSVSLRQTKHPQILLESQRLCGLLIHHPDVITRLCTKSESCPLYHMYRLCANPQINNLHSFSTQIYSQHVNILSSIISQHRSGLSSLLLNSCACTEELVMSTILAMYKLFKSYKKQHITASSSDPTLLSLLLQGILVLHSLAQADGAFCQRHTALQLSYVRLLSGLASLIRPIRSQWEWHATVLDELCDFEPEFHESSSQDSENEDRIEQS